MLRIKKLKIEKLIKFKVKKSSRIDRLARYHETNKNFIIIDFGTATTLML